MGRKDKAVLQYSTRWFGDYLGAGMKGEPDLLDVSVRFVGIPLSVHPLVPPTDEAFVPYEIRSSVMRDAGGSPNTNGSEKFVPASRGVRLFVAAIPCHPYVQTTHIQLPALLSRVRVGIGRSRGCSSDELADDPIRCSRRSRNKLHPCNDQREFSGGRCLGGIRCRLDVFRPS